MSKFPFDVHRFESSVTSAVNFRRQCTLGKPEHSSLAAKGAANLPELAFFAPQPSSNAHASN